MKQFWFEKKKSRTRGCTRKKKEGKKWRYFQHFFENSMIILKEIVWETQNCIIILEGKKVVDQNNIYMFWTFDP